MTKFLVVSFLLFGSLTAQAQAQDILTIHYALRPPYVVSTPEKTIGGLVGGPIIRALEKAKIRYRLQQTPTSRQIVLVKNNQGTDCAVGWFKNEEREQFGQFSDAIYAGGKMVLIANKKASLNLIEDFSKIVHERSLRLLVKDLYSYGPYIDAEINRRTQMRVDRRVAEADAMVKMVAAGRADMMLASEEEAALLFGNPGTAPLQIVRLSDVKNGEKRYLLCTRKVPEVWLTEFNAALGK